MARPRNFSLATALLLSVAAFVPAAARAAALSPAYLAGTWKEDRSCTGADAMAFDLSGVAVVQGSRLAYAVTAPDEITLSGSSGAIVMRSQYVDQDTMLANFGGSSNALYRCSSAMPAVAAPVTPGTSTAQPIYPPTAAFMVGRWTDSGSCIDAMTFVGDGTVLKQNGDAVGNWSLSGSQFKLALTTGTFDYTVAVSDADTMTMVPSGPGLSQPSFMKRCR